MYAYLSKLVVQPSKQVILIPVCSFARIHRTPLSRSSAGVVSASKALPQPSNDDNHQDNDKSTSSSSTVNIRRPEGTGTSSSSSTASVSSVASSSSSPLPNPSWNWVPPRIQSTSTTAENEVIPVLPGILLTSTEIQVSLQAQGAENVLIIPLNPKLESIGEFVVATGSIHILMSYPP